ncbi:MAG: thiamine diphosphokinase, partial [Clostridiales bacterium]|nr:thiamine diphosphokinase [Clostridiales bacterium]
MPEKKIDVSDGDLVIAADAGYLYFNGKDIAPDLIVGDFDSLGEAPSGDNVVRHPVIKDDTDMMLAVKIGLERGYRIFMLYGGI